MKKNTTIKNQQNIYIEELVKKSQDGDWESFGKLYDIFLPTIYRYVYFKTPSSYSEDVTENIFLKIWENIHQYQPRQDSTFSAWIFRIARNTINDYFRKHKSFDEISENLPDKSCLSDPQKKFIDKFNSEQLKKAIADLPEKYQQIIIFKYINDLSNAEIAEILEKTQGAVRILQFRALDQLRTILQKNNFSL